MSGNNRHRAVNRGGAGVATRVVTRGNATFSYLTGTASDGISFQTSFTSAAPYTLFHVARWAGRLVTGVLPWRGPGAHLPGRGCTQRPSWKLLHKARRAPEPCCLRRRYNNGARQRIWDSAGSANWLSGFYGLARVVNTTGAGEWPPPLAGPPPRRFSLPRQMRARACVDCLCVRVILSQ